MTSKVTGSGLAVLIVILAVAALARPAVVHQEQPAPAAPRWEYRVVLPEDDPRENRAGFNKLGAEGWELSVMHSGTRPHYCIFKRPKR
jgi:hypothetical protein